MGKKEMVEIKPFYFDLNAEEIGEFQEGAAKILRSGTLILGEYTTQFEKAFAAFIGTKHAVAVNSGSTALEILLRLEQVSGKVVLVPTNTNFATVAAIIRAGGHVRYLDMDQKTFAPTLAMVQAELERTPAIAGVVWVHIGGVISPAVPGVFKGCGSRRLFVVGDAAPAHGGELGGGKAGELANSA